MVFAHRGCRNMELTDLTWMDIIRVLIEQGLWGIVVACLVIGVVIGAAGTHLYYKIIRNVKMENDLDSAKKELEKTRHERDECRKRYDALKKEASATEDMIYAGGALDDGAATYPDVLASLRKVYNVKSSDRGKSGGK